MTPRADTDELSSRFGGPEILRVEALSKRFVRARVRGLRQERTQLNAVAGVTLSIAPGKTLGLVGESGCGKSTLARLVVRLLEPTSGRIILDGRDITRVSGRELRRVRRRMQIVFQDPLSALNPRQTVGQIVGAPLSIHRVRGDRRARVRELLARVGLSPEHYNRYPHEFSGGQRQRISIARALALDPDLLVLDEPVSSLDVSVQA
ncbi:MAG: ATP-binding cassette domain-containing protein, partial [Gaiellales bacterium]